MLTASSAARSGRAIDTLARAEAKIILRESLEVRSSLLPKERRLIGEATSNLGESIFGQGRTADADLFLVSGYSIMIKSPMAHSPQAKGDLGPLEHFSQASGEPDRTVEFRAVFPVESARPAPYGP